MTPDSGVSDSFSLKYAFRKGWKSSYRETSGYIAETFFDLYHQTGDADAGERAIRIAHWLVDVQNPDGSISNPAVSRSGGIVFDTGQVLHGLLRAHRETGHTSYLESAIKAGKWLVSAMDDDGAWRRNTYNNCPHTYNTRTAWAMLELGSAAGEPAITAAALSNLDWALEQEFDGWLNQCGFTEKALPFTHTIAYAIRGLLEGGVLHRDQPYLGVAERCARSVLGHVREDGFIPARIDLQGRARARYCCLTGNCQLAIIWFKLFEETGDRNFLGGGDRSLGYVIRRQEIHNGNPDLRGAIKGSHPIWGRYAGFSYPNWAGKFFIDAMLTRKGIKS